MATQSEDINEENRFNLSIFSGFILIGFVIIAFFSSLSEDGSSGPASSALWGYSLILFSLVGIIFVKIKMTGDENKSLLSYIIGSGMPVFLLVFNILWLISLNVSYFEDINKGIVSKDFYEYSMLNTILIFVQILISLEIIMSKAFNLSATDSIMNATGMKIDTEQKNTAILVMSFIFAITNFVLSGIQQVTLDYFTTDG
tara:strand:+ start:143 stop:742 length:600 start_codon:yes stop_codon:yes gene_type:complete